MRYTGHMQFLMLDYNGHLVVSLVMITSHVGSLGCMPTLQFHSPCH